MIEPLKLTHPPRPGEADRDRRYTPASATNALIDVFPPPTAGALLDPCGGDGAILRVCSDRGYDRLLGYDIAPGDGLQRFGSSDSVDWLGFAKHVRKGYYSIVTNPPYSIGAAFMGACFEIDPPYTAALLRLNHLGSSTWVDFWRKHPPTGAVVLGSERPSFSGDGKTDASEYVWFVWIKGKGNAAITVV